RTGRARTGRPMSAVTYRFDLTRPQIVSANDRLHWAAKAERTKALRRRGLIAARSAGVQLGRPVRLRVHIGWPDARGRDRTNLAPVVKGLVDGIVSAGVLDDDSDSHIVEEVWTSSITRNGATEIAL